MADSDYAALIDMGFDQDRAKLSLKKGGNLQGALGWLEQREGETTEDLVAEAAKEEEEDAAAAAQIAQNLGPGDEAKSLVCDECGKKFRNEEQAQYHAVKSEHTSFSQSTDEIAPLTKEERQARLEELRTKLAEKRAAQAIVDKEESKRNEQIRQKATKEAQDIKEDLARKEQMKEAARKRAEKVADQEARDRVKARIEAQKEERRLKAEREKATRLGLNPDQVAAASPSVVSPAVSSATLAPAAAAAAAASGSKPPTKTAADYTEARLRLQLPDGSNLILTMPADATLFEVSERVFAEKQFRVRSFTTNFPKKKYTDSTDMSMSLRETGMVPSSVLMLG